MSKKMNYTTRTTEWIKQIQKRVKALEHEVEDLRDQNDARKAETMTYGRIPQEGNRWGYRVEWLSHPQLSAEDREKWVQMMANEICRFGEIPERKSESHRPDRMTLTLIIEEPEDDVRRRLPAAR